MLAHRLTVAALALGLMALVDCSTSPEVANDGEADAVDDARSDAGYVRDVEIRDGEGTDRALMACGPGFCNSDEICVKTQGIGGPYRPNAAGICDTGMLPVYPGFCAAPATYACASLPGACASTLSCACAENPICGLTGSCQSASGSSIWCLEFLQ